MSETALVGKRVEEGVPFSDSRGPVAEAVRRNRIPADGTPVRTVTQNWGRELFGNWGRELFGNVSEKHLKARQESLGIMRGWVPGAGGDLWWVEHPDGTVGVYWMDEVHDVDDP